MNTLIILVVFCFFYAHGEWYLLKNNPLHTSGPKWFLGHFSTYHIFMFFTFLTVASATDLNNGWRMIAGMIFLEDFFYRFAKKTWIVEKDWICWKLGGFYVFGVFIPWTYLILIFGHFALTSIKFVG